LLEVSEAEIAALKEQASLANAEVFTRILETLAEAELNLRDAASKKILLEITVLKSIEARNAMPIDAVLKQLNQMRGGHGTANVSPAPEKSPAPAPAFRPSTRTHQEAAVTAAPETLKRDLQPAAVPVPASPPPVSGDVSTLWAGLIDAVGRVSPFTRSYLIDAHPVSFEKNLLVIGFDPEFEDHLGLVDNARNHTLLQTKLAELGHPNSQIKFIKAEAPFGQKRTVAPAPSPVPAQQPVPAMPSTNPAATAPAEKRPAPVFNKNDFKNDPLIQKALEIFKGQIVEVRA
ncbi:MAG TPA: hypothetical protein VN625_07825, partial [Desulfuromonadaceae bacterium]|nr:hypothetical protein [Desulfuromonadaceae bacterium]